MILNSFAMDHLELSPFPSTGRRWRVSADGGSQARWRRDGSEICYLAPDRKVIAAAVATTVGEFMVKGYEPLFEIRHPYGLPPRRRPLLPF